MLVALYVERSQIRKAHLIIASDLPSRNPDGGGTRLQRILSLEKEIAPIMIPVQIGQTVVRFSRQQDAVTVDAGMRAELPIGRRAS